MMRASEWIGGTPGESSGGPNPMHKGMFHTMFPFGIARKALPPSYLFGFTHRLPCSIAPMPAFLRIFLTGLGIFAAQWLILGRITLWGTYPDAVLLFVAWLGVRKGRHWGAIGGFVLGFLLDAVYNTWGLHMLVKTIIGFTLGLFPSSEREALLILPRQAFLGSLVVALVHNGIFVTLLALQSGTRNAFLVTGLWIGSALYSAFIGTMTSLFTSRNPGIFS